MDNISDDDLRAILRYLDLNIGGTRAILLERLKSNCTSSTDLVKKEHHKSREYSSSSKVMHMSPIREKSTTFIEEQSKLPLPKGPLMRQQSDVLLEHGKDNTSTVVLFDSIVFIDQYTEMEDGSDDRLCLRIQFPKTVRGRAITRIIIKTYQDILERDSHENILANNIFIPTFYTDSGKLFSCNLNIYDNFYSESSDKKELRLKTAYSMKQALTPNKQGLFKLLDCVILGCNYLFEKRFNLLSLDLSSILYSNPAKYLITEFSSEPINSQNYRIQILKFLDSIKVIHNNFRKEKRKSFIPEDKTKDIIRMINTLMYEPLLSSSLDKLDNTLRDIFKNYTSIIYPTIIEIEEEQRQ